MGGGREGKHLKVLVEIDLTQPLLRGTTVKMNGVGRWIDFKYEKCPDFCYCCGRMGHNERNCKDKGLYLHKESQYGVWLKASGPKSPHKRQTTAD